MISPCKEIKTLEAKMNLLAWWNLNLWPKELTCCPTISSCYEATRTCFGFIGNQRNNGLSLQFSHTVFLLLFLYISYLKCEVTSLGFSIQSPWIQRFYQLAVPVNFHEEKDTDVPTTEEKIERWGGHTRHLTVSVHTVWFLFNGYETCVRYRG